MFAYTILMMRQLILHIYVRLCTIITVPQRTSTRRSCLRVHTPTSRLRSSILRRDRLDVLATLFVVCRLRCAGAFGSGLASSGGFRGFGAFGGLARLSSLGGLCSSLSGRVSGAVRGAAGSASRSFQSRAAAAAATLHWSWVLKSQETRTVGDIVVGTGPIGVTLVEQLKVARIDLERKGSQLVPQVVAEWQVRSLTSNVWSLVLRMRSPCEMSSDQETLELDLPANGLLSKPDSSVNLPLRSVAVKDRK
jgi:hypothetical protein